MKLYQIILCSAALIISSCGQSENNKTVTDNEKTNEINMEQDIVKEIIEGREEFDLNKFFWVNEPKQFAIEDGTLVLTTEEKTDLWQHTLNGADLSNAPIFVLKTQVQNFTFTVKTDFSGSGTLYDQCGPIVYMDRDNWLKASVENAGEEGGFLGSVNNMEVRSDWATTIIPGDIKTMWYKVSRTGCDVVVSNSTDGEKFNILRFTHINKAEDAVCIGVYACSPGEGASFKAVFSEMSFAK